MAAVFPQRHPTRSGRSVCSQLAVSLVESVESTRLPCARGPGGPQTACTYRLLCGEGSVPASGCGWVQASEPLKHRGTRRLHFLYMVTRSFKKTSGQTRRSHVREWKNPQTWEGNLGSGPAPSTALYRQSTCGFSTAFLRGGNTPFTACVQALAWCEGGREPGTWCLPVAGAQDPP